MRKAVALFVICLCVSAMADTVIENGGFEVGPFNGNLANGYPTGWLGWGTNGWHHADTGYKIGAYGMAIWANDTGLYQSIDVAEGQTMAVSGKMIYSASEILVNKNAVIEVEFWSSSALLSEVQVGTLTPSDTAATWYTYSDTLTVPSGATEARLLIFTAAAANGISTGKAFWDDLVVGMGSTINEPDLNGDDKINMADLALLSSAWGTESSNYNLSGENDIELEDVVAMAGEWLDELPTYPGYKLLWSDEFNGTQIDSAVWSHEIGDNGWGNNEWEYYTNSSENSYVDNGSLVIVARKDHLGHDYTSARMNTYGKQSFKYGRLEARIKLPEGGNGIWPAFWMLGDSIATTSWPGCGEIDILEAVNGFDFVNAALHYGTYDPYIHDYSSASYYPAEDVSDGYHVYAIEWKENQIRWYYDNVNYYRTSSWWNGDDYPAPFNQNFFFILNIAVGGNWPGYPDETTPFPQYMYVDYVRAYEKIN